MIKERIDWDGSEVNRLREVKRKLAARFESIDAYLDHLMALDKARIARERKKKAKAKSS